MKSTIPTDAGQGAGDGHGAGWGGALAVFPDTGYVFVDSSNRISDATKTACDLFGVADVRSLEARWSEIAPHLPLGTEDASIGPIDLSVTIEGRRRQLRCGIQRPADGAGGCLLLVRPSTYDDPLDGALRLAYRLQTLNSLHASAAHDVRSSLNALVLNVELLGRTLDRADIRDAALSEHSLRGIRREIDGLRDSIGGLLETIRPGRGDRGRVRLAETLHAVSALLRGKAERQRTLVELRLSDPSLETFGDGTELSHALLGLANWYLSAMTPGAALSIELAAEPGGPTAVVTFTAVGTDAPSEMRARIWSLYLSSAGTGRDISLHVARQILSSFDGTVALEPMEPGARLVVRVPLAVSA